MSEKKVSQPQLEMLTRLASGEQVWSHYGTRAHSGPSAFWHGNHDAKAPSMATIYAARDAGWIEDTNAKARARAPTITPSKWVITGAGRAALAKARGEA